MKLKDTIKINIFPHIVYALHQMGVSSERLSNISFFAKSNLIAQAKNLGKMTPEKNPNKQQICFLTLLSGGTYMLAIESLLALGLKKKGHKVTFIIDDNTLPIHELKRIGNESNWDYETQRNYIYAAKFLKALNLNFLPLSEFISDVDTKTYDDKYSHILEATLLKQYKVGVISDDLLNLAQKTEQVKSAIAITSAVGEKLVKIKPDLVVMSHGIYSTWGPPFNILDDHNLSVLVYGRGKKRHTLKFDWNKTGDSWDVSEEWEKVKDKELDDAQLNAIKEYLKSRISHKDDVFIFNFGKKSTDKDTIQYLGLDPNKPIYTLFTNVLWDAASAQREIAFSNPVEWVIETIKWFNQHPNKQLIIKIHPAEVVIGTNMPFFNIIMDRIKPESNVRIIQPHEKVNSWSIYNITTLGIVHTTTAGMELPLVNKPCMVVSRTHYRNKGFTIDINSREEYFQILNEFDGANIDYENNKKLAFRYAYLLFMRYQIPFNMFFEEVSTNIYGFRFESVDDYFNDQYYRNIISNIENKTSIFKN